tara:strand:- start:80 stop:841 length:762 start_codon:yes stop_codon:yes gene_type:complete
MAETLTVDNTPDTEVVGQLNADEQESLEIGEKLAAEEQSLLAGKYKDAAELEKAYIELQSKLGEKSEESSQDEPEQEVEVDEDVDTTILDTLWEEAQSEYTEETLQKLEKMDPKDLAQMHLEYRNQNQNQQSVITEQQATALKDVVGGESEYNNMIGWAKNNLSDQDIALFDGVMDKGDAASAFFAIQALKGRYLEANGSEGEMLTGKAPSTKGDQFKSQAQLIEAMNDPRYDNDPAFRKEVADKLERSDVDF